MHVEVKYAVGMNVWIRVKIKSVTIRPEGVEYQVEPMHNNWDSMRVQEGAIDGTRSPESIQASA